MTGSVILLSIVLLTTTLTNHRVLASGVLYSEVNLTITNGISQGSISGKSHPSERAREELSSCCLFFGNSTRSCGDYDLSSFPIYCSCSVFYQPAMCELTDMILLAEQVKLAGGNGVVFTTHNEYGAINSWNDRENSLRGFPVIFVKNKEGKLLYVQLRSEPRLIVEVKVIGEGRTPTNNPPDSGFTNGRSATTFYFVVFAFTILLLLSLTWFIFNYLRRCHQMYTVKRQRAEMLSKTRKAIDKCPTKTYKKIRKMSQKSVNKDEADSVASADEDERCPICLETFKMKDVLRVLPCQHEFHKSCIDPWLYDKGTCPMCKLNILGNQREECEDDQISQGLRILALPLSMELEMIEEGVSTESTSHNDASRQNNSNESLQVESIE